MQTVFNPARRTGARAPRRWFKAGVLACAMMSAGMVSFGAKAQLIEYESPTATTYPQNDISARLTGGPGSGYVFAPSLFVSLSHQALNPVNPTTLPGSLPNDYTAPTYVAGNTTRTYIPNAFGYSAQVYFTYDNRTILNPNYGTSPPATPVLQTNGCAQALNMLVSVISGPAGTTNAVIDTTVYNPDGTVQTDPTRSCMGPAGVAFNDSPPPSYRGTDPTNQGTLTEDNPGNILTLYVTNDFSACQSALLTSASRCLTAKFYGAIKGPGEVHIVNGNRPTDGTRTTTAIVPDPSLVGYQYLTGANTYTGGTVIDSANLVLGDGTTNGSIVGNVTDNYALWFYPATPITFGGVISGTGAVNQYNSQTTLTAASTYTGGTSINDGTTLQLGDGAGASTNGSIVGNVANSGLLALDPADGTTVNLGASIFDGGSQTTSGTDVIVTFTPGAVSQIGTGTTVLTKTNTYSGPTAVTAGTLAAGAANVFSPASDFTVADATLALQDFSQTVGSLDNSTSTGTVDFGTASGTSGVTLTVAKVTATSETTNGAISDSFPQTTGDYTGGGTLVMSGVLDGSANDVLKVAGDTSGDTVIDYTGKLPATATTGDGILVVQVSGTSGGTFTLKDGPTKTVGGYTYSLVKGTANPKNWYLKVLAPQRNITGGAAPIPTLSETALALLAALLGVSGLALNRRRR